MFSSSGFNQIGQVVNNQLVEEKVLSAPASSVTFSNLNGLADGGYTLEFHVQQSTGSTSNMSLFFNGDTTTTNYRNEGIQAYDGNTINSFGSSDPLMITVYSGYGCYGSVSIDIVGGKIRAVGNYFADRNDSNGHFQSRGARNINSFSNLNVISLVAAVSNGLGSGSTFRLYRKKTATNSIINASSSKLVAEVNLNSASTSIDLLGLDGNTHGGYTIHLIAKSPSPHTPGGINLVVNGDTTSSNYKGRYYQVYTAQTSNTIASADVPAAAGTMVTWSSDAGKTTTANIDITYRVGGEVNIKMTGGATNGGALYGKESINQYIPSTSNITRLTLTHTQAGGFDAGSSLRLYRKI